MSKMNIAMKFRAYPDEEQEVLFHKTAGCCRFIYNKMLHDKNEHYENTGKQLHTTPAKYKKEHPFLKEVDSLALANEQLRLQSAFNSFFLGRTDFPRFKSKKRTKKAYTTNRVGKNIVLEKRYIRLPKMENLKIKAHRKIGNDLVLKSVTMSQEPSGKYYVSILFEYENKVVEQKDTNKAIGLDFSMPKLYVDSEGQSADMPHYYRMSEQRLKKAMRKLSKMYVKGKPKQSKRYEKQKRKVALLHEKVANQRKDYLHKKSIELIRKYDYICIEDLDMKVMSKTLKFGKSVHDDGWGMFKNMLKYKAEMYGKHVIEIDQYYPSSKRCSACGHIDGEKPLDIRRWTCPECQAEHDRDINAAMNIKEEGMRIA